MIFRLGGMEWKIEEDFLVKGCGGLIEWSIGSSA